MRFSPTLLLASVILAAGCAPPATVGEAQAPIIGGTTDTGDPAVMLIIEGNFNSGEVALCTGEVISPHIVLTAGHCTTSAGPYNLYPGYDATQIRSASDLLSGTAHTHPMYSMSVIDNYDIGLIVLDQPVTTAPMPLNTATDPTTLVGQSVRFIGYGSTGSTSPTDMSAGTKRTTTTTLSKVEPRLLDFTDSLHATCEGDSGGPALVTINGVETIIGVTSFGAENQSGCIGGGDDTRVDLYYTDFIQPFIDMYDPPPPPIKTSGPPAPGSVGANCKTNSDCTSQICANAPSGYCTATCNPYDSASACPAGLECLPLIEQDPTHGVCEKTERANSGCSVAASGSADLTLLLMLALWLVARRRLISN